MIKNARNGQVALDGAVMDYAAFGHGRKSLIVLPGLSDGLATVRGKAALLAKPYKPLYKEYTAYMFSRRDPLPEGFTIKDMADDMAEALKRLGIEKTSVMGVSQGGMIAQFFAADHPEMTEKLIIAVSAPAVNDIIRENVSGWISMAERGDHKALMIDTAEKSYSEEYLKKYRSFYPLLGKIGKPKSYDRFLVNAKAILAFDERAELGRISCPTLIIGGTEDKIVGSAGSDELREGIGGSRQYMYEGLGHAAYEEAKDFYDRVYAFLRE